MRDSAQHPDGFANAFDSAFARLRIRVETACAAEAAWPERAAAAIRAALAFAGAHPDDADLLTNCALAAGREGFERYDRMLEHFGEALLAGEQSASTGATSRR